MQAGHKTRSANNLILCKPDGRKQVDRSMIGIYIHNKIHMISFNLCINKCIAAGVVRLVIFGGL